MSNTAGAEGEKLRRAAIAGNPLAQVGWGKILLSLDPPNQRESLVFIKKAADAGVAEAHYVLSRYVAAGIAPPQNWPAAITHLQRAADGGWEPAQKELALLFGASPPDAAAIANVLGPRPRTVVFTEPRIATVKNFLSPAECAWFKERAGPKLDRAKLFDARSSAGYRFDPYRSNRDCQFSLYDSDVVVLAIQTRIANTAGLPVDAPEACAVLHYTMGQEFRPHHDFHNLNLYSHIVARSGQRVVTFLVYLNDDFEGGETDFPKLNWRFKGGAGDAIMFWNVGLDGAGDQNTLHAGLPPIRGEKWLLSQWLRDRNRPGLNVPWAK
jgi:hypothetical protein